MGSHVDDIIRKNKAGMSLAKAQFDYHNSAVKSSCRDLNRAVDDYKRAVEENNRIKREISGKSEKSKKGGGGWILAVVVIILLIYFFG